MSAVRPSLSLLFFFAVVPLVDLLGVVVNSFMIAVLSSLFTSVGAVAGAGFAVIAVFEEYIADFGISETAYIAIASLGAAQFVISLVALTVFYSIVLSSPKGRFSLFQCVLALGVFFIESLPFLGALPLWGFFALFLRGATIVSLLTGRKRADRA